MNPMIRGGIGLLAGSLLVAGCQSADGERAEKQSEVKKTEAVAVKERKESVRVEAEQETGKAWKEKSGAVKAHGAAAIRNTGKKPVEFDSVQLNFVAKDGKVLATEEVLAVVPKILQPGETAYVGGTKELKAVEDPGRLGKVTVNADVIPALKKPPALQTDSLDSRKDRAEKVSVTGNVRNDGHDEVKDVLVTAALKDKDGNLVAVVTDYLDIRIHSGNTAGFEAEDDALPKELTDRVDGEKVEAEAYPLFTEEQ